MVGWLIDCGPMAEGGTSVSVLIKYQAALCTKRLYRSNKPNAPCARASSNLHIRRTAYGIANAVADGDTRARTCRLNVLHVFSGVLT